MWIEFYHKYIILGFGDEEDWGKTSEATSLMKKETLEESPSSKHSHSGSRLAMGRDEGLHYIA